MSAAEWTKKGIKDPRYLNKLSEEKKPCVIMGATLHKPYQTKRAKAVTMSGKVKEPLSLFSFRSLYTFVPYTLSFTE